MLISTRKTVEDVMVEDQFLSSQRGNMLPSYLDIILDILCDRLKVSNTMDPSQLKAGVQWRRPDFSYRDYEETMVYLRSIELFDWDDDQKSLHYPVGATITFFPYKDKHCYND